MTLPFNRRMTGTSYHELRNNTPSIAPVHPNLVGSEQVLSLAHDLREDGYPVTGDLSRALAFQQMLAQPAETGLASRLGDNWMSEDPATVVAQALREEAIDRAISEHLGEVRVQFRGHVRDAARREFDAATTKVIPAMQGRCAPALKVLETARDRGITSVTTADQAIAADDPKMIEAWRDLPEAVATLDRVASLRLRMVTAAGVGPTTRPAVALMGMDAQTASLPALTGWETTYDGDVETVDVDSAFSGTHLGQVTASRTGGAWLALLAAGYSVRINTADEAQSILEVAQ